MEITKTTNGETLDVVVTGRLDGYWADHLDQALTEAVHDEHYRIRLDCSGLTFMSSAGIAVLMKSYKELERLKGSFQVVKPSPAVTAVLRMTRLTFLVADPKRDTTAAHLPPPVSREVEGDEATFEVTDLDPSARLTCRAIGKPEPLLDGSFHDAHCVSLGSLTPAMAIGVGAFGASFADCRSRFGELISVAGATACQPADGTDVPDYLLSSGALTPDIRVLYCLACEGRFAQFVRFEMRIDRATLSLAEMLDECLKISSSPAIGIVAVAETMGLVGGALRRTPAETVQGGDFFAHPAVRTRLAFTAEPAFPGSVALVAGIAARPGVDLGAAEQLRPIGPECQGHLHAAAFRFRAVRKGTLDLSETISGLFDADRLLGVMHLVHDDRGAAGAGDSEFVRGACWIAPLTVAPVAQA